MCERHAVPTRQGTVTVHDARTISIRLESAPGPLGRGHAFAFDRAFDQSVTQSELFDAVGRPLCESALDGFNATIFAYGQTGAYARSRRYHRRPTSPQRMRLLAVPPQARGRPSRCTAGRRLRRVG